MKKLNLNPIKLIEEKRYDKYVQQNGRAAVINKAIKNFFSRDFVHRRITADKLICKVTTMIPDH